MIHFPKMGKPQKAHKVVTHVLGETSRRILESVLVHVCVCVYVCASATVLI